MTVEESSQAASVRSVALEKLEAELEEARAHQRAAAEVLKAIAKFPNETQPVFDAIAEAAADLCGAAYCNIQLFDGDNLHVVATHNFPPDVLEKFLALYPAPPDPNRNSGRAFLNRKASIMEDLWAETTYPNLELARQGSWRAHMAVPILRREDAIGTIGVARPDPTVFSDAQVRLLETFADQALIAIDNARLFEQLEAKTQELEDLNQTLEERVQSQVTELERVGRLRRFLPRQLAEVVINTGDESILDSHRREVSVVFCDLRGFTAFSEVAEPEEVISVLGEYHRVAGPLIEQHGGTLERFLGDGLMVLFNDPLPCEDPAQTAVRLAVALRDAMGELASQWSSQGYELGFGVGIAHGFATLGRIGFEGRSDYTALGSVVNQAARLCDEAGVGEIIITQRIANIAKEIIEAEPLGELTLKGLRQPVRALRLADLVTE
jgi:class 3 adenylate cyclase